MGLEQRDHGVAERVASAIGDDVFHRRAFQPDRHHGGEARPVVGGVLGEHVLVIGRGLRFQDDLPGRVDLGELGRQRHLADLGPRAGQALHHGVEMLPQSGVGAVEELAGHGQSRRLTRRPARSRDPP